MPKSSPRQPAGPALHGPNRREEAVLNSSAKRVDTFVHDFAKDGGALNDVIKFGRLLPKDAIVTQLYSQILSSYTSALNGATLDIKAGSDVIKSAIDAEAATGIQAQLSAPVALSNGGELSLTVGGEDLTGGKARFIVEYLLPNEELAK